MQLASQLTTSLRVLKKKEKKPALAGIQSHMIVNENPPNRDHLEEVPTPGCCPPLTERRGGVGGGSPPHEQGSPAARCEQQPSARGQRANMLTTARATRPEPPGPCYNFLSSLARAIQCFLLLTDPLFPAQQQNFNFLIFLLFIGYKLISKLRGRLYSCRLEFQSFDRIFQNTVWFIIIFNIDENVQCYRFL